MHLLALLFSLGRRSFVAAHALPYYPHYRMEPEARHRAANEDTMIPALMMSGATAARLNVVLPCRRMWWVTQGTAKSNVRDHVKNVPAALRQPS